MTKEKQPILEWMENFNDDAGDEFEWDYLLEELTTLLERISKRNTHQFYWKATVNNFGWRSLDGESQFYADNGTTFLQKILNLYCVAFNEYSKVAICFRQNFHHDSPMGREWYTIKPMTLKEAENYMETH
jgi:hypothetical protein